MSSLFLGLHAWLCLFHLTTVMTRLAVKWKFDYQRERRVDSGERWEAVEMGEADRESRTKQNHLQNLRSFPCHATGFKKPKIKHTSPQGELMIFKFYSISSQREKIVLKEWYLDQKLVHKVEFQLHHQPGGWGTKMQYILNMEFVSLRMFFPEWKNI